jgi:predicted MPP superfamily phosphohydrolase
MEIAIDKKAAGIESLNLVALSDIHLGPYMRIPRLEKIVRMINSLDPDVVLILGDIVNEEALTSEKEQLPDSLGKIRAQFGVYACMGNHEHFAGIKNSLELLRKSGITGLQNKAELVAGSFYLVGRSNRSYIAHNERRAPLKEILKDVNMSLPVILMDHQPVHLEEAVEAGVDLQLSGHTHGGAVFPVTLVNDRLYEIGRGYGRKMNTQYYVTVGVGVWSPPIRIGTTSEIVQMKVRFRP